MISIFYHQYGINDYDKRFKRTFERIDQSGLLDKIHQIGLFTDKPVGFEHEKLVTGVRSESKSEAPTINILHTHAKLVPNGYTLYLHSKGVSHPTSENVQDWVDLLEYFCITRHAECIRHLDNGSDVVGVNFMSLPEKNVFQVISGGHEIVIYRPYHQ